jgi:hypothetical protein
LAKKNLHIFNIQTGPCRNTFSRSDCRNGLQQRLDGHLHDLVRPGHGESAGEAEVQALEQPHAVEQGQEGCHDIQHNDIEHNGTQNNNKNATISINALSIYKSQHNDT